MQPDTIIPDLSNPQSWNRYSYVYNNPVLRNDPTGHCPLCATALIGAAIGGIVGAVGYTAYVAATGKQFNASHFWIATGAGILAGGLIGTGVGIVAGVGVAKTAAVTVGAAEAACADGDCGNEVSAVANNINKACGDDFCASEAKQVQDKVLQVTDKARTADKFLTDAQKFLGDKYEQVRSGIYRSMDGLRQVRFTDRDLAPTHGSIGPHGHFELLNKAGEFIKNIHIPLIDQ